MTATGMWIITGDGPPRGRSLQIGPAWPGRIIAAWMLSLFVKREPEPRPVLRPADFIPTASASRGLWQPHGRVVLRLRLSEQQLSWETLGAARGQWSVAREGPDTATIWYTP